MREKTMKRALVLVPRAAKRRKRRSQRRRKSLRLLPRKRRAVSVH